MAYLIPKVDISTIENSGEQLVAKALVDQLPNDCVIYHSYPWISRSGITRKSDGYLAEGEADFIIVHPKHGIMVLEVKGGSIEYDAKERGWSRMLSGGNKKIKDPFIQAEHNLHAIKDILLKHSVFKGASSLPFVYGYGVVFPHCQYSGELPSHVDRSILFSARDIQSLEKKIDEMFAAWGRVHQHSQLTSIHLDAIQEALSPVFHLTPVLWRTIEDQEDRLKRLTDEQERLLDFLEKHDRVAIEGVAGSGKTILALSQAQRFARQDKRTALICYNRPLANWLTTQMSDRYSAMIDVDNFHGLCSKFCKAANIECQPPKGCEDNNEHEEFWKYKAAELLERALDIIPQDKKYDAIVIDEAQDFQEVWWIALENLYRDNNKQGPLSIFYDPKQNIYVEKPTLPANMGMPFILPTNCRNTRRIAAYCGDVLSIELGTHKDAPDGESPSQDQGRSWNDVVEKTRRQIQEWCLRDRGALRSDQVAILTLLDKPKSWPNRFGDIDLVHDFDDWRNGEGVLVTTFRKFKGLEADAIVIAGVPEPGKNQYYTKSDHYVACSRAKHLLKIVYSNF